ncbi:unnamed protein product [Schistocephalus solidus]|uniref:Uncharacterized protein n=1 Tax=Schistocephalus solidus TaxID=70667 RepID=A0A183TFV8_SCHSO|nr:unnamed protein product [Schistocephalus solidus]
MGEGACGWRGQSRPWACHHTWRWERTQVAGAAGAAPGRTTTPGSDPTERTQVAGAAGSPKSKPPLGVPQEDAGGWRGWVP